MAQKTKQNKWPTIRVVQQDRGIINSISSLKGPFRGMTAKDILVTAAAIAIEEDLPADERFKSYKMVDSVSYANLNTESYGEYRQYITLIYYLTAAGRNVENMSEPLKIVRNFEDYAHRGILYLKEKYLTNKNAENELTMKFLGMMNDVKEKHTKETKAEREALEEEERNLYL